MDSEFVQKMREKSALQMQINIEKSAIDEKYEQQLKTIEDAIKLEKISPTKVGEK